MQLLPLILLLLLLGKAVNESAVNDEAERCDSNSNSNTIIFRFNDIVILDELVDDYSNLTRKAITIIITTITITICVTDTAIVAITNTLPLVLLLLLLLLVAITNR